MTGVVGLVRLKLHHGQADSMSCLMDVQEFFTMAKIYARLSWR